nr:MAG TPA: tail tape measure protein [Caudoviricetes sp.]
MADGYLNFDTKINEKGFNEGVGKLSKLGKSGLSIVSKTMTGAVVAVGTAAGAIIKSSLGVVANMEQQVGGVETLFKDSANTVIDNANRAYKTAGMSANNYMETVTSFSASLLQSLGGDTAKAASYADRAIVAMSDNANKMGTSMRDIQNAYQGFAKQNYTMLDNLKLGYGGTQEEMKRLVSDAAKLTDVQKELGVTVDANSLSFGNIVNAISVVQKQMGITGTTSKEAATTIEGSVSSAKAAWENFEAGVISANDLVETFWTATQNIFTNLGQIIPRLGKTGIDVVSALAGKIGGAVPQVKGFTDAIESIADKLGSMDTGQLANLGKMSAVLIGAAPALSLIGKGAGTFSDALGGLGNVTGGAITAISKLPGTAKSASASLGKAGTVFKNVGDAIALPFQDLAPKIAPAIGKLGGSVSEMWNAGPGGKLTSAVTQTAGKVGESFAKVGPKLAEKFPTITGKVGELGKKVSAIVPKFGAVGEKIASYGGVIGDSFKPILSKAATFAPAFLKCMNIAGGLGIVVAGLGLLQGAFGDQIGQILTMVQTKGPEVITNFCNGITAALPNLIAQGAMLLNNLLQAITANLPAIISGGISIVSTLISGIAQQLPTLIPTALMMIVTLVGSLLSNLGQIVDAGIDLLVGLAQGLVNALPQLINQAPTIIGQLATAIISNLPKILQAGIKIITILATGLVQAIPQLIGKIPAIISQIKNAFTSVNWGSVGMNIVKGIASGLTNAAKSLADAAANAASNALDWVKSKLGIHSPSRVFRDQVGKMMALGMGIGFEKNIPIRSMSAGVQKAVSGLQRSVNIAMSGGVDTPSVDKFKNSPGFDGKGSIDYDRLEKIQMRAAEKMAKRPIFLGTKRIDEPLPKGAVPAL